MEEPDPDVLVPDWLAESPPVLVPAVGVLEALLEPPSLLKEALQLCNGDHQLLSLFYVQDLLLISLLHSHLATVVWLSRTEMHQTLSIIPTQYMWNHPYASLTTSVIILFAVTFTLGHVRLPSVPFCGGN